MKKEILVAKEFYETFERLKYNEDFVKFKEDVVDKELERLSDKVLESDVMTTEGQLENAINTRVYQELVKIFSTFFDLSESQAKMIRKTVKVREKKRLEEKA